MPLDLRVDIVDFGVFQQLRKNVELSGRRKQQDVCVQEEGRQHCPWHLFLKPRNCSLIGPILLKTEVPGRNLL